jgi:pyruvate dehydrogenase E1 component beta subunit
LGKARRVKEGKHLTIVSWSKQVMVCEQAVSQLHEEGIEAELLDLRSIWPWDRDAVLQSCAKTGHLLVVHEAVQAAGFGAEIAATAAEVLGVRVRRLGAPRIPVGYAAVLEEQSRVALPAILAAARQMCSSIVTG